MIVKANDTIVNNVEYTSFKVEKNITSKVDVAYLKFIGREGEYVPQVSDEIKVELDGEVIFFGILNKVKNVWQKQNIYDTTIQDFTIRTEQRYVVETYENQLISDIVRDVVTRFVDDIDGDLMGNGGFIMETPDNTVAYVQYDYARPSDVIRELGQSIGYDWWVDTDKKLHFVPSGLNLAPFNLADDNESYVFNSLELENSDKQLKNVVYIKGGDYVGTTTRDKLSTGDGSRKRFNLPYKYDKTPTVYLDNVVQNVGIDFLNQFGGTPPDDFSVLYNFNEKVITFENAPLSGAVVEVEGDPLIPLLQKVSQPDEKGTYEYKIVDKTIRTSESARQRAEAEIDAYGETMYSGQFRTYRAGLETGQKIYVESDKRNIEQEEYVIQQINISMRTPTEPEYKVKLANVAQFEIVEFIRSLLRSGEKEAGIFRESQQILEAIIDFGESVYTDEQYGLNDPLLTITLPEQYGLDEEYLIQANFNAVYVYGDYSPTGLNDPRRTPTYGGGADYA